MSLKSMHEAKRSSEGPSSSSSTELLRQQRERITELEQANASLRQQLSEAQRIGSENLASATAAAEKKIAELTSELQRRKQNEQQLSEQLETQLKLNASLSNSDLQLKEAERLQEEARAKNAESQRKLTAAMSAEEAAHRKIADAWVQSQEAEKAKAEAERLAEERTQEIEASAKKKAHTNELYYRGWLAGAMGYGFLVTVFSAIRSETLVGDFKAFFLAIWGFLSLAWEKLLLGANTAAGLADKVPQEIAATILHWVILVVIVGFALAVFAGGLLWLVTHIVEFYRYAGDGYDNGYSFADNITLAELLISLAALVFFAEPIRAKLPINLLLLYILCHAAFIGIRWLTKKNSKGY